MFRKRNLGKRNLITFMLITAILFLLLEGLFYVEKKLRPAIIAVAAIKANAVAIEAINRAILDKATQGVDYQDLIQIERDEQGKIVLARLNSVEANRVMAETSIAIKDALGNMERMTVRIPLGEVTDNYLLAAYGPSIPVRFIPAGKVNTELEDRFESAGINQTRHKIHLRVHAEMQIVIPFTAAPVMVDTTVPVTDTIYLGQVPDTVINIPYPGQVFP